MRFPRQVRTVEGFAALLEAPLHNGINALCWPRTLAGDFAEITTALGPGKGIAPLDEAWLQALSLSPGGRLAREVMLADLHLLRERGLAPELNCIYAYPRDNDASVFSTDVYSWHADSAPIETATWLCTYHGAASEGLPNTQARRKSDDPILRAALLREYGGKDDVVFDEFLREHGYAFHFTEQHDAKPWSFGTSHLWRIAVDWPGSPVPPCIHRAPQQAPGNTPRLLLIC